MNQLITWGNIDKIEEHIKTNLEYFSSLRAAQLARKQSGLDIWEKTLFVTSTWAIMRIPFRGFMGYCRYLIDMAATTHNRPSNVKEKLQSRQHTQQPASSKLGSL